ncbi:amino acid dehydrogenase [Salegentibacter salinarum]|uniref:Amino acid dehydrogenase n=1 Tax=Salegentibacter salinarum TaxID=447422 RepID=A0A2N0U471_9FLAO|nr:FAD-dependent oxidoreductase [Salegentibacter salinarum]PKD21784.1 amino acid dehydrogenase [Salegentibacter salinarum]SKB33663.1 D-amino-acid dehydrogenase [Salegentibacter salinarum]
MKKVAIIGGGITGLCSAYYLIKEGYNVTIIDKGDITGGASFINAGYVTPSHFIPIAEPGMITQGIKWMFNSSSPFYIKPRWDMEFFKWAWYFKKSSTRKNVEKAIPVLVELNLKSRDLYTEMLETLDFDFHMEKKGLLMVYKTAKNQDHELKLAERGKELGLEVSVLDKEAIKVIEPGLKEDIIGGVHYLCDTHSTPYIFMKNLKKWLADNGANFILEKNVTGFKTEGNRVEAIVTEAESIEADEFLIATGSWTSEMTKQLGLHIPIQPGKGYSMDVLRKTNIKLPAILTEAKVAVTPMQNFTRFAGTMEFSGNNSNIQANRVETIANAASHFYKDLTITEEEKKLATSGLRPVSPDGLPFIGKSSKYSNLSVAAGHAMMGWSLGPVTGKLISEIVGNRKTSVSIDPFKLERF